MSLIEQLGGIKTEFAFFNNGKALEVSSQYLTKRGKYNYDCHSERVHDGGAGYGYGYGLQGLYFEILFNDKLVKTETEFADLEVLAVRQIGTKRFETIFYADKVRLFSRVVKSVYNSNLRNEFVANETCIVDGNNNRMLSIDLTSIPLTFLSKVTKVDLVRTECKSEPYRDDQY